MSAPRTTREALFAQMMGELDALLTRVENLPQSISDLESRFSATTSILDEAGEKYRTAVIRFTEEARTELTDYLQRQACEVSTKMVDEHRAMLAEAARVACHTVHTNCSEARSTGQARLTKRHILQHCVTAILSSAITATLILGVVPFLS